MKEQFYIDIKRREEALKKLAEYDDSEQPTSTYDKFISRFEPRYFPKRECSPVVRRRTMEEVRKLIEDEWKEKL